MKNSRGLLGSMYPIVLCLLPWIVYGQPKAGHFKYGLISYTIIDTAEVDTSEALEILVWWNQFYPEFYFNNNWVVALQTEGGGIRKSMFDRKSSVLYTYYNKDEMKRLRIDSIQALKRKDKKLLSAIDTLKSDFEIIEYPKQKRRIHGYLCHKVDHRGFNHPPIMDEIWLAKFGDVPNLIFPDEKYFLIEGIPLEITQELEDIIITWGVTEILSFKPDDDIFKQTKAGYEVSFFDSRNIIYEGIQFIRTHEPNTN